MKKNSLTKWLSLAAASALTLLAGMAPLAQAAAFDSPVGAWDFTLSGRARGIALITFNPNGSIDGGVHIYTTKKAPSRDSRSAQEESRTGDTNAPPGFTNYFGSATIGGWWSFDERGKIVGFLNEGSSVVTGTATNATTNSITFSGVVRLGSSPRITLRGHGPVGTVTYTGIPEGPVLNISTNFSGTGKRGNNSTVEFFTLTSLGGNDNVYNVVGVSPGFAFGGRAVLSGRNQISMVTTNIGTNGYFLTALVGSINTNKVKASFGGRDNVNGTVSLKMFQTPP